MYTVEPWWKSPIKRRNTPRLRVYNRRMRAKERALLRAAVVGNVDIEAILWPIRSHKDSYDW